MRHPIMQRRLFTRCRMGMLATGHLLNSNLHGPRWLSGGSIGPEGSLMSFVIFAIAFARFHKMYPVKRIETSRCEKALSSFRDPQSERKY